MTFSRSFRTVISLIIAIVVVLPPIPRGCCRGRGATAPAAAQRRQATSPGWNRNYFNERQFTPDFPPRPRNIPDTIDNKSTSKHFFDLFWTDDIWEFLGVE